MDKKDKKFMTVAEAVSETCDFVRIHIGAVIVKKNRIISVGCNLQKTHPIQAKYDIHREYCDDHLKHRIHAEVSAIISAKDEDDLDGATMYIYRKNKYGKLDMCRPCNACYAMMKEVGIKRMVYSIKNGFAEEIL